MASPSAGPGDSVEIAEKERKERDWKMDLHRYWYRRRDRFGLFDDLLRKKAPQLAPSAGAQAKKERMRWDDENLIALLQKRPNRILPLDPVQTDGFAVGQGSQVYPRTDFEYTSECPSPSDVPYIREQPSSSRSELGIDLPRTDWYQKFRLCHS